jgi:HSP20 family protein
MSEQTKSMDVRKSEMARSEASERTRDRRVFIPRTDVFETDDHIIVLADVPGVDEKAINITLEKNVLTIEALVEPDSPKNYALTYAEYEVGDYQRSFTLSDEVDRDKIDASVKDGVLRLQLPKAGPAKTRRISVKPR